MCPKFPGTCESCYFYDRGLNICDECEDADQFENKELDEDGLDDLRDIADSDDWAEDFKEAA
jgi:hypothetical protein